MQTQHHKQQSIDFIVGVWPKLLSVLLGLDKVRLSRVSPWPPIRVSFYPHIGRKDRRQHTLHGNIKLDASSPSSPKLPFPPLWPVSQDKMRFYKGTDQYVVAVTAREGEGRGTYLTLSVIPQRLGDLWIQL